MFSAKLFLTAILLASGRVSGVDVSFEDGHSGFFVKTGHAESSDSATGTLLNRDQFIVLHPSRAAMVRVSYGPFTAKQTVPYPSSLPLISFNQSVDLYARWPATTDVTAYLVTPQVRREQPVLRALFHFTQSGRDASSMQSYQDLCVVLVASRDGRRQTAVCSPSPRDTTCLAEINVPHSWWPPLQRTVGTKVQKNVMTVEYAVAVGRSECSVAAAAQLATTLLWQVPILPDPVRYSEVMENGSVQILVPLNPVYGHSKLYMPVFVRSADLHAVNVFVMRARVKSGLKILHAETSMPDFWTITVDKNPKGTVATVTAFANEARVAQQPKFDEDFVEVFAWLLEVEDDGSDHPARMSWTVRYVREGGGGSGKAPRVTANDDGTKMTTEIEIHKDDIQSVLLVSKTWELVNTAMLNGKQVSQPVKVFLVSQAGKVADVTLQSSCRSLDESILKVSPSCTSVYLDGSEVRGSHNVTVTIEYGTYTGSAHFTVWVPEIPLDVVVGDARLSQVRGWKAPKDFGRKVVPRTRDENTVAEKRALCRLRYQQTPVSVYARFLAVDDKSGRESYLLNRKSAFRVTDLVRDYLRVADPRIATLKGRVVQGHSTGRTEVQVLSPITGRVIGATELRVAKDKELVTGLRVDIVSGLQLSIKADYDTAHGFVAETIVTHRLTAQYQEGLLDIGILFSDGTSTPLADVSESDFVLSVDVHVRNVIALAPMASPYHPRVIALGDGNGTLTVSVEIPDGCRQHSPRPLARVSTTVVVHTKKPGDRSGLQNDDFQYGRGGGRERPVGGKFLDRVAIATTAEPSFLDDVVQLDASVIGGDPLVQARQNPDGVVGMSSLEVGMYALLGIVCLVMVLFVTSCAVYAVRFHRKHDGYGGRGLGGCRDPVANAHDWVWLGRSTLERKSVGSRQSRLAAGTAPAPFVLVNENASGLDEPDSRPPTPPQRIRNAAAAAVSANPMKTFGGTLPPPVPPHAAATRRTKQQQPWMAANLVNYDVLVDYFDNLKESNA